MLRKEKEAISNAEKKAYNVIHSLQERLNHLQVLKVIVFYCSYIICNSFAPAMQFNLITMQISVQESVAEKRKLEEHIQIIEACFLRFFNFVEGFFSFRNERKLCLFVLC